MKTTYFVIFFLILQINITKGKTFDSFAYTKNYKFESFGTTAGAIAALGASFYTQNPLFLILIFTYHSKHSFEHKLESNYYLQHTLVCNLVESDFKRIEYSYLGIQENLKIYFNKKIFSPKGFYISPGLVLGYAQSVYSPTVELHSKLVVGGNALIGYQFLMNKKEKSCFIMDVYTGLGSNYFLPNEKLIYGIKPYFGLNIGWGWR